MENRTSDFQVAPVDTTSTTITIKGILSLLLQNADENDGRRLISLGMGDPTAFSCFHTTHVSQEAVVDALQSDKFNGYAPTVGLPQTRRPRSVGFRAVPCGGEHMALRRGYGSSMEGCG
ncbi:hypothetical protein ACFX2I_022305 [Malus domestica]